MFSITKYCLIQKKWRNWNTLFLDNKIKIFDSSNELLFQPFIQMAFKLVLFSCLHPPCFPPEHLFCSTLGGLLGTWHYYCFFHYHSPQNMDQNQWHKWPQGEQWQGTEFANRWTLLFHPPAHDTGLQTCNRLRTHTQLWQIIQMFELSGRTMAWNESSARIKQFSVWVPLFFGVLILPVLTSICFSSLLLSSH